MTHRYIFLLAPLLLPSVLFAQTTRPALTVPPHVHFAPDVEYLAFADANGTAESLKLDIASPDEAAAPLPALLLIHGGGWTAGNRQELDSLCLHFVQHGYVAATVEYRLAPRHPFPACVQDVRAAVRFLRANAGRLHVDPHHVGAVGFSAGAHLAMMLSVAEKLQGIDDLPDHADQSTQVQAAVSFFGPTDLNADDIPKVGRGIVRVFLGGESADTDTNRRRASPITYVSDKSAPMLLLQGTADPLVPWDQATKMATTMQEDHVPGRVELIVGIGHGWGGAEYARTFHETIGFFDQYLKPAPH